MNAIDVEVCETVNGVCVSLRAAWSPAALSSALEGPADGNEADIREYLASRLSEAMRLALLRAREEAGRNLLKAYADFLSDELAKGETVA